MARYLIIFQAIAVLLCSPSPARAQSADEGAAPAHVSFVDGTATLERDRRVEKSPLNMPLLAGDRLRTEDGRLEVLFADGSTLHLDSRTTVDIESDDLLRLIDGRVRLNILGVGSRDETLYRIDSPAGSARLLQPGAYRIELLRADTEPQLELAVLRGAAEIFTDQGTTSVRAGERAYASAGMLPSYAYTYNSAAWDSFDRWSESRRDVALGASTEYLPPDLQTYSPVFDEYGDWQYTQSYGYVWYPRVAAGWRPYYYGRWMAYPRFGWTWVGIDRFSWPTHHYGRWGFSAGAWFWIPSHRWAPAYVSWAYAPGYVSWCPLGFDNRPVIGIDLYRVGPGYYSPWRAWTVVSYADFGRSYYVHNRVVHIDRLDAQRRPAFTVRAAAPAVRDVAIPRGVAPVQYAGRRPYARNLPAESGSHNSTQRAVAVPRSGTAQRDVSLPPSGGRSVSGDRSATEPAPARARAPRYVNRGTEIIRSQTARPIPPNRDRATDRQPAFSQPERRSEPIRGITNPQIEPGRAAPRAQPAQPSPQRGEIYRAPAPVVRAPGREYTHDAAPPPRVQERAIERPSPGGQGVPSRVEGRPAPAGRPEPRTPERPAAAPRAEPRGESNHGGRETAQPRQSPSSGGSRRGRGGV
jgi:uncharacterized protein DUF6600/FecR-like protein